MALSMEAKSRCLDWIINTGVILLVLAVTLLANPLQADAAPVRVGTAATGAVGATAASSFTVTFGATPTIGNTMIAVIATRSATANAVVSVAQTGVNWSRVASSTGTLGTTTEIWSGPVGFTSTPTITITLAAPTFAAAVVMQYNGLLGGSPADKVQTNFNSAVNTTATTGTTATTVQGDELWIAGFGLTSSGFTATTPASFSLQGNSVSASGTATSNARVYYFDQTVTSTGTASASSTVSSSLWSGAIATFRSSPLTCTTCHGGTGAYADGTSRNQGGLFKGSHNGHVQQNGMACAVCHVPPAATAYSHEDGTITMATSINDAGGTYSRGTSWAVTNTPDAGFGTCSATNCHGATSTLTWATSNTTNASCSKCHGIPNTTPVAYAANPKTAAPGYNTTGRDTGGATATTDPQVGTHDAHLRGLANIATAIACNNCHQDVNSASASFTGHMNGTSTVVFFGLATTNHPTLPRQYATGTCTNTYCHGAKMPYGDDRGTGRIPAWTNTGYLSNTIGTAPTPGDCGMCHGNPPTTGASTKAANHVGYAPTNSCKTCHPHVNTNGTFNDKTKHMNGIVEGSHVFPYGGQLHMAVAGLTPWTACSDCHNTTASTGTSITYPVANGVAPGCRSCHLQGLRAPTPAASTNSCWDCHGASATNAWPNGTAFPNNNRSHSAHATFPGITCNTCHTGGGSSTGNHGSSNRVAATQAGVTVSLSSVGTNANWQLGSLGTETCATSNCHGQKSPAWGSTANASPCLTCHGVKAGIFTTVTSANIAPGGTGVDTSGTSTTGNRVGTHQAHLTAAKGMSRKVLCSDCHTQVATTAAAIVAHLDYTTAKLTFSSLANGTMASKARTVGVSRSAGQIVCTNSYCHAGFTGIGATSPNPSFNTTFLNASMAVNDCNRCHGLPPLTSGSHGGLTAISAFNSTQLSACNGCHTNINATGTSYANIFIDRLLHINGLLNGNGTCIGCHALPITRTVGRAAGRQIAAMTGASGEFGLAWGHKKSGRSAVTDADCIVCHLEGEYTTGKARDLTNGGKHKDGNIDLRDPDGAGEAAITNISGTAFTFARFSTSYAAGTRSMTGHTSNTDIANVITQKFCLKCHDSNGAINTYARSGTAPTQYLPFGTGSQNGAAYTVGLSAGVVGGVVNVDSMFATTNSTFHPVKGPRNNSYASGSRMKAPYGVTKTNGTPSNGVVLNCFDCHNQPGTPKTLRTVTAHGASATNSLRGVATITGTASSSNAVTLCNNCHAGYDTSTSSHHGTGSAIASSTNNGMTVYMQYGCNYCHASNVAATRPTRAEDIHGFNRLAGTGTDARWPVGATETSRPYAFIRKTTTPLFLTNHRPLTAGTEITSGSATCAASASAGSPCAQMGGSNRPYTPGGVYP